MTQTRSAPPWPSLLLVVLCAGAIVAAILLVGPAAGSQAPANRTALAASGVVQSTVSGSGNVEAASELDLGFKTAGVVSHIYVTQGQHVTEGKLLAELDPKSTEVALEQARANLQQAEANLLQAEEAHTSATGDSESSGSSESPDGSESGGRSDNNNGETQRAAGSTDTQSTLHASANAGTSTSSPARSVSPNSTTFTSPALREADIASAKATVRSDRLAVQSAEEALADTRLFAPQTGTIVALAGEVGETVSASGTTRASSASASGSSTEGDTGLGSGASSARSSTSSGSGGSGTSAATFAVLSDLSSMQLVAPLSESEVSDVRPGQPATVAIEALEGTKLAAHVVSVATLPTSNSGVVSYDVTFQLDQLAAGLKPGMSATAEVVVKQAEGVNVPTSAISGGTVTVVENGKQVRRKIVAGLVGNSSTIVLAGLRAGEEILLPIARASTAGVLGGRLGSALAGRLGGTIGGALGGGAIGGGGGTLGGGAIGFRGSFRGG